MGFAYLRDPLFLACVCAYWVNRFLKGHGISPSLFQCYLNDLICIPFWIPVMLWVARRVGLRQHDDPPYAYEIVIPLVIWAVVFEVALPLTPPWPGLAVADPNDVLCYALGGFAADRYWAWRYGRCDERSRVRGPSDKVAGTLRDCESL